MIQRVSLVEWINIENPTRFYRGSLRIKQQATISGVIQPGDTLVQSRQVLNKC